jgi:hypothetical protein
MTDKRHPQGQPEGHPDGQPDRYDERLDALFKQLGVEKAPPSLTRRLYRIPREEGFEAGWRQLLRPLAAPRWVLVPAFAAALLAIGVVLVMPEPGLQEPGVADRPSQAAVLQARQDLALAFKYIDKAGVLTGREIQSVLSEELIHPVKDNLSKHIPFTEQSLKEETT